MTRKTNITLYTRQWRTEKHENNTRGSLCEAPRLGLQVPGFFAKVSRPAPHRAVPAPRGQHSGDWQGNKQFTPSQPNSFSVCFEPPSAGNPSMMRKAPSRGCRRPLTYPAICWTISVPNQIYEHMNSISPAKPPLMKYPCRLMSVRGWFASRPPYKSLAMAEDYLQLALKIKCRLPSSVMDWPSSRLSLTAVLLEGGPVLLTSDSLSQTY